MGGSDDASHLIVGGWLPFLQSFDGPDINLWHEIVSDFHEMGDDRLDAAYWIMEQPACDRATVWTFLIGMVSWDVLHYEIESDVRHKTKHGSTRFNAVVNRWDDGFYKYHSLRVDPELANGHHGRDPDDLRAVVDKLTKEKQSPPMLWPKNMDIDISTPTDDMSRSSATGLEFSDETGLTLIAGFDWAKPEWHPNA